MQRIVAALLLQHVVPDVGVGVGRDRAADQQRGDEAETFHVRSPCMRRQPSVACKREAGSVRDDYKLDRGSFFSFSS
ncbi:hypothetical protein [Bradyrhizobium sp. LA6.12]|uniref:hypothetical protein n=1 Tax=unclassified Bradyrhizobium TaxID=2631580 RepID=UPI00339AF0E0